MRTLWNIMACLALANILGIAGVLGWLHLTDRLNRERLTLVREAFARTIAQEVQVKAEQQAAAEKVRKDAIEAEKMVQPPVGAAEKIGENAIAAEEQQQVLQRRRQDIETLRQSLMAQMAALEDRERHLKEERAAFDAERKRIADTEGAQAFKSALATLEAQKPKDAKQVLGALLAARQQDQVVSYLAKMEEGKRGKVIAEFVKEDPAVAAELLERLRTRGTPTVPAGVQTAANDASRAQPAQPVQR